MIKENREKEKLNRINVPVHKRAENPKITVIVPVYKVDRYLTMCLNSIVNQTMEELEIIIIDEGEKDRCREIIDYFEAHDPRIIAPHQKNGGYGASCNLGIDMARGEYIAIVESDDCIEPWMYEEMYDYAEQLNADVVKSPFVLADKYGRHEYEFREYFRTHFPSNQVFSARDFNSILRFHGAIWSAIYRTDYLRKHNINFSEVRGGAYVDIVFRYDTLTKTDRIAWLNRLFYVYTVDEDGEQHNNHNIGSFISRWKEIHKRLSNESEANRKAYAPVLLYDEIGDTLSKLQFADFSNEEIQMLKENLELVEKETIESAMHLDEYPLLESQKRDLLEFLRNSKLYCKKVQKLGKIKRIADHTIPFLNKLANTTLLIWLFVMTSSSVLAQILIKMNYNIGTVVWGILYRLCGGMGFLAFFGCLVCGIGKITRKLCFKMLEHYKRNRKEGAV